MTDTVAVLGEYEHHSVITHCTDSFPQVSIFLKTGAQLKDGRFVIPSGGPVPHGFEPPGIIR